MGRKLDILLRRNKKPPKVKTLASLAASRITILNNQHQVRSSQARSDVVNLLNLGHHDSALLRVEHVIREQNLLDAYAIIENYCHLLIETVALVENSRDCPDEVNEAISSLIFAASRCGEIPELQEIRGIFTTRYGKDFAARAVELRNNCTVNPKIVQKLSLKQPSLETRQKLLKQIASDNGIVQHLEEDFYATAEVNQDTDPKEKILKPNGASNLNDPDPGVDVQYSPDVLMTQDEKFSESMNGRNQYRDVAAAAQAAFESAAYAAAAARAAVELSRSEQQEDEETDDHDGSNHKHEMAPISQGSSKSKLAFDRDEDSEEFRSFYEEQALDKIHPIDRYYSDSDGEEMAQNSNRNYLQKMESRNKKPAIYRTLSSSSSDTDAENQHGWKVTSNLEVTENQGDEIGFDESDDELGKNQRNIPWLEHHYSGAENKFQKTTKYKTVEECLSFKKGYKLHYQSPQQMPLNSQVHPKTYSAEERFTLGKPHFNGEEHLYPRYSHAERKQTSMTGRSIHRD